MVDYVRYVLFMYQVENENNWFWIEKDVGQIEQTYYHQGSDSLFELSRAIVNLGQLHDRADYVDADDYCADYYDQEWHEDRLYQVEYA